ncbi:hypothetical protein ACFV1W_25320 [Kitasatospora sp. NPDC059648]|uniref:hypothetical protein n=1 Tax=Kitasatospora sp. NPDC059648 TaxID=3346894 RepID=UPI00369B8406
MTDLDAPAVDLVDTRQDCRWVLSAMSPGERRQLLDRMSPWVDWLVNEYPEMQLQAVIPRCWYRHRGGWNKLIALYVAWVRVYVEPGENQGELALVAWDDALERVVKRLQFPVGCLEAGTHVEPHTEREPWESEPYLAWLPSAPEMTTDPFHPAPFYKLRPKGQQQPAGAPKLAPAPAARPTAAAPAPPAAAAAGSPAMGPVSPLDTYRPTSLSSADMDRLITAGTAEVVGSAVRHLACWWVRSGDGGAWLRLQPEVAEHLPVIRDLDARLVPRA